MEGQVVTGLPVMLSVFIWTWLTEGCSLCEKSNLPHTSGLVRFHMEVKLQYQSVFKIIKEAKGHLGVMVM